MVRPSRRARLVCALSATGALLLGVGQAPGAAASAAAGSVTFVVSPDVVLPTELVTMSGRATGVAGAREVRVVRARYGRWRDLARVPLAADGTFSYTAAFTVRGEGWVLRALVVPPTGPATVASQPVRLQVVRASAELTGTRSTRLGGLVSLQGAVTPGRPFPYVVQRLERDAGWVPVASGRLDGAGRFSVDLPADHAGTVDYRLVADYPGWPAKTYGHPVRVVPPADWSGPVTRELVRGALLDAEDLPGPLDFSSDDEHDPWPSAPEGGWETVSDPAGCDAAAVAAASSAGAEHAVERSYRADASEPEESESYHAVWVTHEVQRYASAAEAGAVLARQRAYAASACARGYSYSLSGDGETRRYHVSPLPRPSVQRRGDEAPLVTAERTTWTSSEARGAWRRQRVVTRAGATLSVVTLDYDEWFVFFDGGDAQIEEPAPRPAPPFAIDLLVAAGARHLSEMRVLE